MKNKKLFSGLRDFLILWGSQFVSSLGTGMTTFALIVWVYGQNGSASSLALMSICALLPSILFSFIAGAIADRWDKKRTMLLAFGGLEMVLAFDLAAFAISSSVLLLVIKIPAIKGSIESKQESFVKSCLTGIGFLRKHTALLRIILFFAGINFIAKMGSYGMLPALILGRTGGDQAALGAVEAAVGIGVLAGSIAVTLMKPAKSRVKVIFFACGISFLLGDVGLGVTHTVPLWMVAAFASNVPMAFLNANLTAVMRTNVPIAMQGRVFSARDTLQYSTIPLGLFLGGVLADHVLEPFMASASPVRDALTPLFGTGKGSGMAVLFFVVGVLGCAASFLCLRNPLYKTLD